MTTIKTDTSATYQVTDVVYSDGTTARTMNGMTFTYGPGIKVPAAPTGMTYQKVQGGDNPSTTTEPVNPPVVQAASAPTSNGVGADPNNPPTGGGTTSTTPSGSFTFDGETRTSTDWLGKALTQHELKIIKNALVGSGYFRSDITDNVARTAWQTIVNFGVENGDGKTKLDKAKGYWDLKSNIGDAAIYAAYDSQAYALYGSALQSPKLTDQYTKSEQTKKDAIVQLQKFAYDNGIVISAHQLATYGDQIASSHTHITPGKTAETQNTYGETLANIEQNLRNKVIAPKYKVFADDIKGGSNVRDLAHDYIQMMAQSLEIDPNKIDLAKDPLLGKALLGYAGGADGKTTVYPNYTDFQQMVQKDSRWQYTQNAHQQITDLASKIQNAFGF
jgi:hypothetical protein